MSHTQIPPSPNPPRDPQSPAAGHPIPTDLTERVVKSVRPTLVSSRLALISYPLISTPSPFIRIQNPPGPPTCYTKADRCRILRDGRPGSPKAQPRLPQGLLPRRQADGGAGFADIGGGDGSVEGRAEYGYGYESGYQSVFRSFRKRTVLILSLSLSLQFVEIFTGNM
jgi:hypothetical protein